MAREMKDSGVEWIGEIPKGWEVVKVKNIFKNTKKIVGAREKEFERLALTLKGVLKRDKNDNKGLQSEKFSTYQILEKDELVFKMIDLENKKTSRVGFSKYTGIVSPVYIILNNDKYTRYGYYFFYDMWQRYIFNTLGNNGVRSALNAKDMLNLPFLKLDLKEQEKIANYLDKKVADIDLIIEKTKATIEDYKKYKQSIITEAVTKGLNSNVEMKETNNIHIKFIPKSWKLKKLKYLFSIKKEIAGKKGLDVLSITQKGIKIKDISTNEGQMSMDYSKYQILNKGDFAMNHMDLLTGWVDISQYDGVTSPDYRVFVLNDEIKNSKEYYLYLMQICYSNRIFYGLGQGVSNLGRWRLQAEKFLNFSIPVPTLEEQQQIAEYLDKKISEIDNLIAKKESLINEMEEYKKSLIYECVTGKKEII